jgi:translation initiation factor 3 subunit J
MILTFDISWLADIDEPTSGASTPPAPVVAPKPSARSKWQDEDKEESEEVSHSSIRVARPRLWISRADEKGRLGCIWFRETKKTLFGACGRNCTFEEKLAEKERLAAEKVSRLWPIFIWRVINLWKMADDQGDENEVIETLTEQDRRRIARERELESDLAAAADLMGTTGVEDGTFITWRGHEGELMRFSWRSFESYRYLETNDQSRFHNPLSTNHGDHHRSTYF